MASFFKRLNKTLSLSGSQSHGEVAYSFEKQPEEYEYWKDDNEDWTKCNADEFIQSHNIDKKKMTGFFYNGEESSDRERDTILNLLTSMKKLECLSLKEARLTVVPDCVCEMTKLTYLYLGYNSFNELPSRINRLKNLEVLWLIGNKSLQSLPDSIIRLSKLRRIYCSLCDALTRPPQAVCQNGMHSVKAYFKELKKTGATQAFTTVVLLGEAMAGKTSLLRTLQTGQRTFTKRTDDKNEATKVVSVEKVDLESQEVIFIDFGGQDIYHHTYPLSIKENSVPVFLVNLYAIHKEIIQGKDLEAIVNDHLFGWLSNAYTIAPNLGPSALVLTHTDKLSTEEVQTYRQHVLQSLDALKNKFLEGQELFFEKQNENKQEQNENKHMVSTAFTKISHIQAESPIFTDEVIFEVGDSMQGMEELTIYLSERANELSIKVPNSWKLLTDIVLKMEGSCVDYKQLVRKAPKEKLFKKLELTEPLRYLHSTGLIAWYDKNPKLKEVIFHRLNDISAFIQGVFDHEEIGWSSERYFKASQHFPDRESLKRNVQTLKDNGLMTKSLLLHSVYQLSENNESPVNLPPENGINLLVEFHLAYGPVKSPIDGKDCFYIPALCMNPAVLVLTLNTDEITLAATIIFKGLPLPRHVYHKLVVCVLHQLRTSPSDEWKFHTSGVTVMMEKMRLQIDHNHSKGEFDVKLVSSGETIGDSWVLIMTSVRASLLCVKTDWPGVLYEVRIPCSHCLLVRNSKVEERWEHAWTDISQDDIAQFINNGAVHSTTNTAKSKPLTGRCQGQNIPFLLKHPPEFKPSHEQIKACTDYISNENRKAAETSSYGHSPRTAQLSFEQTPYMVQPENIGSVLPTTDSQIIEWFFEPKPDIYKMTDPCRGRCLIINNTFPGQLNTRFGSEIDLEAVTRLFRELQFNVEHVPECRDISAALISETQLDVHNDYGAFALVIMSHGGDGYIENAGGACESTAMLWALLDSENFRQMAGKPKLVLVQACSGATVDPGVQTDSTVVADAQPLYGTQPRSLSPPTAKIYTSHQDLLIAAASYPGTQATRSPGAGSPFINAIVETFSEHACDKHVLDLLTTVSRKVAVLNQTINGNPIKQTPHRIDTLTKSLYLFPGLSSENK